jgi:PAS domain-containing protein
MPVSSPSSNQLTDLFINCSVAVFVTDRAGNVLLRNKAADVLTGEPSTESLPNRLSVTADWDRIVQQTIGNGLVENVKCDIHRTNGQNIVAFANISSATTSAGRDCIFWVVRPGLKQALPVAEGSTAYGPKNDAATWISEVNTQPAPTGPSVSDQVHAEILELFFQRAPVAIHLIAHDGSVVSTNSFDITLVGHDTNPDSYVGHHIRQIYQDQKVVEDFMNRWDEDAPIINFRANFVRKDGGVEPVLIYSTANAEGGGLQNTRCFVFRDPLPQLPRDKVSAFDFPTA